MYMSRILNCSFVLLCPFSMENYYPSDVISLFFLSLTIFGTCYKVDIQCHFISNPIKTGNPFLGRIQTVSANPGQTPHTAVSDLGLHCLLTGPGISMQNTIKLQTVARNSCHHAKCYNDAIC